MDYEKILNNNINLFEITRNGLLGQDFKTKDNRIIVLTKRYGSGFTMGKNYYEYTIDGNTKISGDLGLVYKEIAEALNLKQ